MKHLLLIIVLILPYKAIAEISPERLDYELIQGERIYNAILLANVAICEASVEGRVGMFAVMDVVLNRVNHHRFPNTIEQVIFQRHQFECIQKGIRHSFNDYGFTEAYYMALDKLDGVAPHITKATHYYAPKKMPGGKSPFWAKKEYYLGTIGNHRFFKLYP